MFLYLETNSSDSRSLVLEIMETWCGTMRYVYHDC